MFRIAYEGSDFREAARLLLDFNAEFDAPVPDSVWFKNGCGVCTKAETPRFFCGVRPLFVLPFYGFVATSGRRIWTRRLKSFIRSLSSVEGGLAERF